MKFYDYDAYITKLRAIYKELERKIYFQLPHVRVEHVGASSVKGCLSKGDLDILVAVDQDKFEESIEHIKALGFYEKKNTLRTDQLCMFITDQYQDEDVAIQLIVNGSSFENFIRFRNILRSCPTLLDQYNDLKKNSMRMNENEYRKKKSVFVASVLDLTEFPNSLAKKVLNISEGFVNPERAYENECCALWINSNEFEQKHNRLKLVSVVENNLWNEMFKIRKDIELTEYGIDNDIEVKKMIDEIKTYVHKFKGEWFLAQLGDRYIGEIGLVPIYFEGNLYGRLQDVDILSSFRGQGYANDLIRELMNISRRRGMKGLGVRALNDSWIRKWYERLGFLPIEIWK